jgi:hypothetical protein
MVVASLLVLLLLRSAIRVVGAGWRELAPA